MSSRLVSSALRRPPDPSVSAGCFPAMLSTSRTLAKDLRGEEVDIEDGLLRSLSVVPGIRISSWNVKQFWVRSSIQR